jgi:hypothetical protein
MVAIRGIGRTGSKSLKDESRSELPGIIEVERGNEDGKASIDQNEIHKEVS